MTIEKRNSYVIVCDNCGKEGEITSSFGANPAPGWIRFDEGKHNCPECVQFSNERLLLGDPPG